MSLKRLRMITPGNKRSWYVGINNKSKLKPAGPHIALYQCQMAFFYMRKCITPETNLTQQILV